MEQVSLDLRAEFPNATGFSPRNLWFMRQWFLFYCSDAHFTNLSAQLKSSERKLKQVDSQLQRQKLKQVDSEIQFPPFFGLVPWMHHVLIIQKCETVDEALFYVEKTVEENLSRDKCRNGLYLLRNRQKDPQAGTKRAEQSRIWKKDPKAII